MPSAPLKSDSRQPCPQRQHKRDSDSFRRGKNANEAQPAGLPSKKGKGMRMSVDEKVRMLGDIGVPQEVVERIYSHLSYFPPKKLRWFKTAAELELAEFIRPGDLYLKRKGEFISELKERKKEIELAA